MKTTTNLIKILLLLGVVQFFTACATIVITKIPEDEPNVIENPPVDNSGADTDKKIFTKYPALKTLYEEHGINQLAGDVQDKFIFRYEKTLDQKYRPKGGQTFCTAYFYDYYYEIGYRDMLGDIIALPGETMVEKILNYEKKYGEIQILWSGYEAQKLANKGKEVAVIGEYYYDEAEKYFTRHYSVVQPSMITYDEKGEPIPYYISGLVSNRNDVNNRYGTGVFLAQTGVANGLIDFRWAYNRKMNGLIQRDSNGNIRGGILFVLFPDKGMAKDVQITMAN